MRVSGQGHGSLRMRTESGCPVLSVAVITRHVSSSAARDESSLFHLFINFSPLFFGHVIFLLVTTYLLLESVPFISLLAQLA